LIDNEDFKEETNANVVDGLLWQNRPK
jgi:hypothetical protein